MAKGVWTILNVDNVDKSVEFYKALGLRTKVEPMELPGLPPASMGSIDLGGSGVLFWNKNIVPPDQPANTRAWVSGELGKGVMVVLGVPNAQKLWTNVQRLGVTIELPLREQPWGGREFTFVDNDGYVVNVTDKFPDAPKPKKAVKKVTAKAKSTARKVVGKGKRR